MKSKILILAVLALAGCTDSSMRRELPSRFIHTSEERNGGRWLDVYKDSTTGREYLVTGQGVCLMAEGTK